MARRSAGRSGNAPHLINNDATRVPYVATPPLVVIAGLVPATHTLRATVMRMDGRHKASVTV
jgi:hypothetical protein